MEPTDIRRHPADSAEEAPVTPLAQRLDRVALGVENISDALGLLVDRLRPVLPDGLIAVPGDDQPEPPADGASPLSLRLHQLQSNAHYLADKIRAVANTAEL